MWPGASAPRRGMGRREIPATPDNGPARYLSDRIDPNNQKSVLQALVVDGEDHTNDWSISDFTLHELRTCWAAPYWTTVPTAPRNGMASCR